jgi:hypothetical protein
MDLNFDVKVLIITFLVSVLTIKVNREPYLKYFPAFLLAGVLVELAGTWFKFQHRNNTLLYNLYTTVEFSYFLYFFEAILTSMAIKKMVRLFHFVLPAICLTNIFLIQGPNTFHTYSYAVCSIVIDILGIVYFIQLFNSPDNTVLVKTPAFWIVTGITFFYIASLSFLGVLNYASSFPKKITSQLHNLFVIVDTLLYILFIIALTCRLNTRKSTSNS